jgi:hypothetical protein
MATLPDSYGRRPGPKPEGGLALNITGTHVMCERRHIILIFFGRPCQAEGAGAADDAANIINRRSVPEGGDAAFGRTRSWIFESKGHQRVAFTYH